MSPCSLENIQRLCMAAPGSITLHYVPYTRIDDGREETDFRLEISFPTAAGLGKVGAKRR
jgi:hypothetical protein